MKPVLTFVLGAALAGGVAFFAMRKPAEPTAVAPVAAPVEPAASIPPAAAPSEPERSSEPSAPPKRSAMPKKAPPPVQVAKVTPPANDPVPAPAAKVPDPTPATPPSPPSVSLAPPRIEERQPEPRVPRTITIPAGTIVSVRLDEALSSERNQPGDSFRALIDQPLVVDGLVIAERGARVTGKIVEAERAGRVKGVSKLAIELTQLNTSDGQRVKLRTEPFSKVGETSKKSDATKIGAAAAIGAAIGAIAGGGKGAAIGAGAGGAAGTGGVMATRGKDAELPIETRLTFHLSEPVNLTEKLR